MKTVKIVRHSTSDSGTFGVLHIDDVPFCFTGELPLDHDQDGELNEQNLECIPEGEYYVSPRKAGESAKFKYLHYVVKDVPEREYILIHKGNYVGDVTDGLRSDIQGCIIVGTKIGKLGEQECILNSGKAFNNFVKQIGENTFKLIIENKKEVFTEDQGSIN